MTVDTTVQELEQRLKDCTHDLTTLLALRQMTFERMTDPTSFVWLITDEARQFTSADFGAIFLLDGEGLSCAAALPGEDYPTLKGNCPLPLRQAVIELAIQTGQPICIAEVQHDPRVNTDFVRHAGIQSLLVVPFKFDPEPVGVIVVGNEQVRPFNRYDERALELLAPTLIIGVKVAQLYRQEQERRREAEQRRRVAEGLGGILAMLNSHHSLDETLNYIAVQAGQLLGSDAVALFRLDSEEQLLTIQAAQGLDTDYKAGRRVPIDQAGAGLAVQKRQPLTISNLRDYLPGQEMPEPVAEERTFLEGLAQRFSALLAVPLMIKGEVYGSLVLYYPQPQQFSKEEINLAVTFGDQAALAIENARLQARLEQAAVVAERSRLARDLHDAVTQTLFSASLIAEVLPEVWVRRPDEGQRLLQDLRQLSRGALAEMRTLLLELRPSALAKTSLDDLLRELAEAMTGRTSVPAVVTVEGEGELPAEVRVALYRIAQEALNNVTKHANAGQVEVSLSIASPPASRHATPLRLTASSVELRIRDDGRGFDPSVVSAGHLGLGIMRERAAAIGATLNLKSQPGRGTEVVVIWQDEEQRKTKGKEV